MDVTDAIKIQRENYEKLKTISTPTAGLEIRLAPVNGTPVEVRKAPIAQLKAVMGNGEASVMKYEGKYVIFIADALAPAPSHLASLTDVWLEKSVVYHEYGHILEGDVFEDDPPRIFSRYQQGPAFDWHAVEERAECRKMFMLLDEATAGGNAQLVSEIQTDISYRGLVRRA